jgi:micrococcal nuclease
MRQLSNDRSGNVIILPGQGGQSGSQVPSDNDGRGTSRPTQPAITDSSYPFGYVRNVVDGDTLNALIGSESQTVRLACIDAPEEAQEPVGMLASNRLTAFLSPGRQFTYRSVDTDQYGRMVAEIYISGASLNVHLVKEGMAVVYPQYLSGCSESRAALLAAESEARASRRGFWSQSNPVMPWDFRQQ